MGRIALIGDVQGHVDALARLLDSLGVVDTLGAPRIPPDLTVVQVGDLVHRGPDSEACVALADRLITGNPGQWIQLLGNHEAAEIPGPMRWPCNESLDDASVATIRGWWDTGVLRLAVGVQVDRVISPRRTGDTQTLGVGPMLVTHAGLTAGCWQRLGAPTDLAETVRVIEAARDQAHHPVFRRGGMLEGGSNPAAGPLWASCDELHGSWDTLAAGAAVEATGGAVAAVGMPWSQGHGHAAARTVTGRWRPPLATIRRSPDRQRLAAWDTGITRVTTGDRVVWGLDPDHSPTVARPWGALVVEGELIA